MILNKNTGHKSFNHETFNLNTYIIKAFGSCRVKPHSHQSLNMFKSC